MGPVQACKQLLSDFNIGGRRANSQHIHPDLWLAAATLANKHDAARIARELQVDVDRLRAHMPSLAQEPLCLASKTEPQTAGTPKNRTFEITQQACIMVFKGLTLILSGATYAQPLHYRQ
mgnify:CR=1 FL=1